MDGTGVLLSERAMETRIRSLARRALGLCALVCAASASGAEPLAAPTRPAEAAAVERGLAFLVSDALAWKADHGCVSCHHAALPAWAFREAAAAGFAVDEPFLNELRAWIEESGSPTTSTPRPEGLPKALNVPAVQYALALGAGPDATESSRAALDRCVATMAADQTDDGSWDAWPNTRPPIFGPSDDSATALACLALAPFAEDGHATATAALARGAAWLAANETDGDPQSVAARLMLARRTGSGDDECALLVRSIVERRNADGGWSQAPDMASDAWATGQALYALAAGDASAGGRAPEVAEAIERGRAFLVSTQREDGSWPMTSRPMPDGSPGSGSLVPIVGAGSAWGVLGLVRSGARGERDPEREQE